MSTEDTIGPEMKAAKETRAGLLPVEEALRIVISEAAPLGTEEVGLERAAGRVLAETVAAPFDMPAFDRSAMDGYAVRAADVAKTPVELEVVGFLPAGRPSTGMSSVAMRLKSEAREVNSVGVREGTRSDSFPSARMRTEV